MNIGGAHIHNPVIVSYFLRHQLKGDVSHSIHQEAELLYEVSLKFWKNLRKFAKITSRKHKRLAGILYLCLCNRIAMDFKILSLDL